jgi:SAM-dependent methyltransferase
MNKPEQKETPRQEDIAHYYDMYVGRQKQAGVNARHKSIFQKALALGLQPSHHVLEIGCGIGTVTGILAQYLKSGFLFSCDISPESIATAKERLNGYSNIELAALDATDFYIHRTFDMVILPDVIEHIPQELHARMFQNIDKMLRQNGVVYIHIPSPYYLDWCRSYRPHVLQMLDQSIYLDSFMHSIAETNLYISEEQSYCIWMKNMGGGGGEYIHRVLRKKPVFTFDSYIEITEEVRPKMPAKQRILARIFHFIVPSETWRRRIKMTVKKCVILRRIFK